MNNRTPRDRRDRRAAPGPPRVTEAQARALVNPWHGNPWLVWDGTRFLVAAEPFARRFWRQLGWTPIMTREELADLEELPDDLDGWDDAGLVASRLTDFALDEIAERCESRATRTP